MRGAEPDFYDEGDDLPLGHHPALFVIVLAVILGAGFFTVTALMDRVSAGTLHGGPELLETPEVVGLAEADARQLLLDTGLEPEVSTVQNVSVDPGHVVTQNPAPGERVTEGSSVKIVVSVGDGFTRVPDVRGSPMDEMDLLLFSHGLGLGDVGYEESDASFDEVIGQLPAPGEVVPVGTVLHVMASAGPPLVEIPDVAGLAGAEARRLLQDAGFLVEPRERHSWPVGRGDAISTDPAADAEAPRGSTVVLFISRGPAPTTTTTAPPPPPPPPPPVEERPSPPTTAPRSLETFAPIEH